MKIAIAGAGIMGRLLAFSFVNAGWHVSLYDKNTKNNCSEIAAGLLTPISELEKNDLIIFQLGTAALTQYWPNILSQLPNPIYFQQKGSLILAHPHDKEELTQFIQTITHKLDNHYFYQSLDQDAIKTLEPEIEKFHCGYYFTNEGQMDNQSLLVALKEYLIAKKIAWHENVFVRDLQPNTVILENHTEKFDLVVDCRGLGATTFRDLRPIRGEIIWLHAPNITITRPIRFLHPRYSLYIAPRPNQTYLIGASEIESNDTTSISVRTLLELLTAASYIHAEFLEARVINTATQCRPVLENHLPKIKYAKGIIAINGLYKHGFLIAPTLVDEIMRWMQKGYSFLNYPKLWEAYK